MFWIGLDGLDMEVVDNWGGLRNGLGMWSWIGVEFWDKGNWM